MTCRKKSENKIDYRDKQAILRRVAYHMQTRGKGLAGNIIHQDDLERILTENLQSMGIQDPRRWSRLLIDRLRKRNFILCFLGAEYYAFVHRTFLEFFCAWEIVEQFGRRDSASGFGLTKEKLIHDVYGKHWPDESWHEILRLIAGMIDVKFVGEIVQHLMAVDGEDEDFMNLFLAANCLAEVRNRSAIADTAELLCDRLGRLVRWNPPDINYIIDLEGIKEWEKRRQVRTRAVSAVASTWRGSAATFAWLQTRAMEDDDEDVRQAAVQELARGWKDDPDVQASIQSMKEKT